MFRIIWEDKAEEDLLLLPNPEKIINKVESYLVQSPRELGKALTGSYKGLFRYRFGNYRIIYTIDSKNELITIIRVGHRKEIYK